MSQQAHHFRKLQALLKKEIPVHQRYLEILKEQRGYLVRFQADKMQALNAKRDQLNTQVKQLHEQRVALMTEIDPSGGKRLSDIVASSFSKTEQRQLLPMIQTLKELVTETQKQSVEFQGVTNFALNMVHGSISLLWQATQNVTKHYGANGQLKESYSPTKSRHERVLKQA